MLVLTGIHHGSKLLDLTSQQSILSAQLQILLLQINDPHRNVLLLHAPHVPTPLGTLIILAPLLPVTHVLGIDGHRPPLLAPPLLTTQIETHGAARLVEDARLRLLKGQALLHASVRIGALHWILGRRGILVTRLRW